MTEEKKRAVLDALALVPAEEGFPYLVTVMHERMRQLIGNDGFEAETRDAFRTLDAALEDFLT